MAGFTFRFQPVLNLRQQVENVRKFELAKSVTILEEQKDKLSSYENTENRYLESMSEEVSSGMDLQKIREYNSYLLHMRNLINNQKRNVQTAEYQVEENRDKLKIALVEKKTMEKLKSKHKEEYIKEQIKKEQLLTDEITSYKYKTKIAGE